MSWLLRIAEQAAESFDEMRESRQISGRVRPIAVTEADAIFLVNQMAGKSPPSSGKRLM